MTSGIEDHRVESESVTDSLNGRIDALNDITETMIWDMSAYVTPPVPLPGGRARLQLVAAPATSPTSGVVGRPPRPPGKENLTAPSSPPASQGCSLVAEGVDVACQKDLDDLRFKVNHLELQIKKGHSQRRSSNNSFVAEAGEDVEQLRTAVLDLQEQLSDTQAQLSEARVDVRDLKAQFCVLQLRVVASCSQCTSITAPPGASISMDPRSRSLSAQHQHQPLPALATCCSPTSVQHGVLATVCPSPPATTRYVHHGFTPPSQHQSVAHSLAASTGSLVAPAPPSAPTQPLLAFATDKLTVLRPPGSSSAPCIAGYGTPPPTARVLPMQFCPFSEIPALPTARGTYAIVSSAQRPPLPSGTTTVKVQEIPRMAMPAVAG